MVASPTQLVIVEIQQGDDHPLVFPVLENKIAQDCTGWTAKAQVRTHDGDLLHTWSVDDGSAVCDADGVSLLLDDSDSWEWKHGYFDVRATSPAGTRVVPASGAIRVRRLWTR